MNQLIGLVTEHDLNKLFYDIFFAAGFCAVFIFAIFNGKKYEITRGKALIFVVLVCTLSVLWMFTQCWIENGFKSWGGKNIVRTFVWVPVAVWLIGKLMNIEWSRGCDFVAPCVPMIQAVSHWGCIFAGCCHGYPVDWGIYNPVLETKTFPSQIAEILVSLAIFIIICRYEKNHNYKPNGLAYPMMLMMFGYSRFFLEFLRENQKVMMGISALALHALFMALVGTAVYVTVKENAQIKESKRRKHK